MMPSNNAQMIQLGLPGAGPVHNFHVLTSHFQQGQAAVQMTGQEVQQDRATVQGATVNHFNHTVNLPVYTNTVSTPCVSFPVVQVNNITLGGHIGTGNSRTGAGGGSQVSLGESSLESADTVIPSLQALRNSADIHRKVNAR